MEWQMGGTVGLGACRKPERARLAALALVSATLLAPLALADGQSTAPAAAASATPAVQPTKAALVTPAPTKKKAKHRADSADAAKASASKIPADGCGPTPEQASIGLRALQTELMVAGLKCSAEQWNTFTAKFQKTIKLDADRLQRVFNKSYGKSGPNQMNAFVTQLANDASQRSNGYSEADYCKQEDVLYKKVLAFTTQELERFSAGRELKVPSPVALCKPDPVDNTPPAATVAVTTVPAPAPTTASLKR
jgi:hypothetical protein